jgi:homogentisate phytyltransferase/homogentisate geranylgeranyltransferase
MLVWLLLWRMLTLIWKFSRPHTLIGSSISIVSLLFLVLYASPIATNIEPSDLSAAAKTLIPGLDQLGPSLPAHQNKITGFIPVVTAKLMAFFGLLLPTLIVCLLCNIFITGLNQIVDVELDKINKPHLPLASGELTVAHGKTIVAICGGLSVSLSWLIHPFFGGLITLIAAIGAMYSLPPIQFKKHHVWAASAIALVRGPLINLGIALHFSILLFGSLNNSMGWLLPLVVFVTAFSLGIAWFKDIPDTAGDERYGYKTLALVWSKQQALNAGRALVVSAYVFMAMYWFFIESWIARWNQSPNVSPNILAGLSHIIFLLVFLMQCKKCDIQNPKSIKRFYMFYWGLFFLEYLLLPILLCK